ncbi:hypothetical protein [Thalassotalea litorea]|uniref:hypothetical protein n=1 Tax=Thalassotalea litorea TaxID=2020715 RepID=UPI0037367F60
MKNKESLIYIYESSQGLCEIGLRILQATSISLIMIVIFLQEDLDTQLHVIVGLTVLALTMVGTSIGLRCYVAKHRPDMVKD